MTSLTLSQRFDPRRFFQGEKPTHGPVTLAHRRIFTIPNKRGFGLILLLLIQWLAAINYNSNLGYILTFLLVAVALLGVLHGYRNLAGLRVQPRRARPVFAGEHAIYEILIANPTPLPRYALWVKAKGAEPIRLDIAADDNATAALGFRPERRGWFQPGTVTLYTEFPLGILYAWSPLRFAERVLVYPKPAPDSLPFPMGEGSGRPGRERLSGGEEFTGFQTYQAGDPLRHIHWKGVAKGQEPQVKRYAGEQSDDIALDLNETPGGDLETRLSRLCRWVIDAEAEGLRYALTLPGTRIATGAGDAHRRQCLEALAVYGLGV